MSLQARIEAAGVPFLTRDEWGASVDQWRWNSGSRREPIAMSLPVDEFYVHHSVTLADDDGILEATDDVAANMREIEAIGLNRFGRYSYSFGLHPSGVIAEGCGNWIGAHTYGRNSTSLAGVAIGNYERDRPPKALIRSYGILLRALRDEGWTDGVPHIGGHRDVRATGCPGGYLYAAIPDIRGLAALTPAAPQEDDDMARQIAWLHDEEKGTHAYLIAGIEAVHIRNREELNHHRITGATWLGSDDKANPNIVAPFIRPMRVLDGPLKNIGNA